MGRWREYGFVLAGLLLGGCSSLQSEVDNAYSQNPAWTVATTVTTADVRLVTTRKHPLLHNEVLCSEPSPDIGKAVGVSFSASVKAANSAAAGASVANTQALAEFAGRSTALVGLRDALYRACEAYANGIIGQDAYALVTGRYHELMAALFLGQDISSGTAATTPAKASSDPGKAAGDSPGTPAPAPAGDTAKKNSSAVDAQPSAALASTGDSGETSAVPLRLSLVLEEATKPQATPNAELPSRSAQALAVHDLGSDTDPAFIAVANPVPAVAGNAANKPAQEAQKASPAAAAPVADGARESPDGKARPASGDAAAAGASTVESVPPLSLVRLYEDYVDHDLIGLLMVACINNGDQTRLRGVVQDDHSPVVPVFKNNWLDLFCGKLAEGDPAVLSMMKQLSSARALANADATGKVDPVAGVAGRAPPATHDTGTAPAAAPAAPKPATAAPSHQSLAL